MIRWIAVREEHDSYEASSCGSGAGSQDDRSDVASWVALDLRHLRHQRDPRGDHHDQQHRRGSHAADLDNGYDVMTIDSDFYGYAASGRSSGVGRVSLGEGGAVSGERPVSWAGMQAGDSDSLEMRFRNSRHPHHHDRYSTSTPSHYLTPSSRQ